jgi:hypothetical protein
MNRVFPTSNVYGVFPFAGVNRFLSQYSDVFTPHSSNLFILAQLNKDNKKEHVIKLDFYNPGNDINNIRVYGELKSNASLSAQLSYYPQILRGVINFHHFPGRIEIDENDCRFNLPDDLHPTNVEYARAAYKAFRSGMEHVVNGEDEVINNALQGIILKLQSQRID